MSSLGQWWLEISARGAEATKAAMQGVTDTGKAGGETLTQAFGKIELSLQRVVKAIDMLRSVHTGFIYESMMGDAQVIKKTEEAEKKTRSWTETIREAGKSAGRWIGEHAFAGWKKLGSEIAGVGKLASGTILGLFTVGLSGTAEGNKLAHAFHMLGREIAAVALPAVQAVTDWLQKATRWMRELSGSQQDSLLKWGGLAVGVGLFASGIGAIPGAILMVVSAWNILQDTFGSKGKWVGLAIGVAMVATGIGTLPGLILAAASAWSIFSGNVKDAEKNVRLLNEAQWDALKDEIRREHSGMGFKNLIDPGGRMRINQLQEQRNNFRRNVTPVPGSFESITASYSRIQQSLSQKDTIPEKQLAVEEQIRNLTSNVWATLRAIQGKLGGVLPAN